MNWWPKDEEVRSSGWTRVPAEDEAVDDDSE